ncbi:hypothetical protein HZA26_00135 [Candidatus Nomurabacteria bacterium]|nr:hypothetical protein [Candidatus Nomurabacteria bacterium]
MSTKKSHDSTANRIAKKFGTDYNKGKGADIITPKLVVEVETPTTVKGGLSQLQGYKKLVYIAGANKEATQRAIEKAKNTTIGVMDSQGKIIKSSSRGKK